jgi:hypothetical protein
MSDEKMVVITDDANMHRAFLKLQPFKTHPADMALLDRAERVVNLDAMADMVEADMVSGRVPRDLGPGMTSLSGETLKELAHQAPETYYAIREELRPQMTLVFAVLIREMRLDEGYTWRALAQEVSEWDLLSWTHLPENQLAGMALCELAADHFEGEHFKAGAWNDFPEPDADPLCSNCRHPRSKHEGACLAIDWPDVESIDCDCKAFRP